MKSIFRVKNAKKTVKDVFINGLKQLGGKRDFTLTNTSIKVTPGLEKGEVLTFTQETTIKV